MIFNHSPSNHVDLYPQPCSARLLTCTTNFTLAPLSSCCRKGRSFYGSLLSQNCCGEMAGSADLPGAPKLAQFSVGKCGQIWDNANRYTKYKICVKICHNMLHMSYVWNNPLNFQTKINIYQHVSFLIFDVRIQQIKPWGTATRSCHRWCPCSPAWRTSATVWKSGRTGVILQLGHDKRNGKHVELWKRVQRHETSFLISSK